MVAARKPNIVVKLASILHWVLHSPPDNKYCHGGENSEYQCYFQNAHVLALVMNNPFHHTSLFVFRQELLVPKNPAMNDVPKTSILALVLGVC